MKSEADTLLLVEGPFDALKTSELGRRIGIVSTCFFTAAPTYQQTLLLHELCARFPRKILLLDAGTFALGLRVARILAALDVKAQQLQGFKDPGEIRTADQLLRIVKS
jgi:hypothetical protein